MRCVFANIGIKALVIVHAGIGMVQCVLHTKGALNSAVCRLSELNGWVKAPSFDNGDRVLFLGVLG